MSEQERLEWVVQSSLSSLRSQEVKEVARNSGNSRNLFDLMVLGGGSAGFAAAIKGAELGFKVALGEADTAGGTCVNAGCVAITTSPEMTDA